MKENSSSTIIEEKVLICSSERKRSLRARFAYGIMFTLTNLGAWFLRDYGERILPQLHYVKACGIEGTDCVRTIGVLRVSLGCFIFFFLMFLTTSKTSKLHEVRNAWHSEWWPLKFIFWIVSLTVPFFLSSEIIQLYGELAYIGAGIFLILQLVSVIHFISWWNNYWMPDEKRRSCSLGLVMSTIFYIASICGIALMYPLYAPRAACALNIFFITWTAVLVIVMMAISLHSKVNKGLLSSGIMASYVVFLCWSAVRSEPVVDICGAQKRADRNVDWTTILGFLIAIGSIIMATFSTGIDSQSFQFSKYKIQSEDDVPYNYGFFHLVFSLGSMYFAMLLINWSLRNTTREWSIDVGWASTWVKIINEWFAATVYLWQLIYPVVRESKIMDHEEPANNMALP